MKEPLKIFKAEAFLIPLRQVEAEHIALAEKLTTYRFYDEKACSNCSYVEDRHCDTCETCPAFKSAVQLGKVVDKTGKDGTTRSYLSMPLGNQAAMKTWLKRTGFRRNFKVIAKHAREGTNQFSRPIQFTGTLRPFQKEALKAILEHRVGVIEAPPRSGKTVVGAAAICKIGEKALILAHQREWLMNFRETFVGSDTQEPLTNAKKRQVRFCKSFEEFRDTDVCLATFQQFMNRSGRKMLERIQNLFTIVVVDEVHQSAATESSRVLSRINSRYRIGLTGTPDRKDCLAKGTLVSTVVGRVPVETLKPGDLVLSYNHRSFCLEEKAILDSWSVRKEKLYTIRLESGAVIRCSANERFCVDPEKNVYATAQELAAGAFLWRLPT